MSDVREGNTPIVLQPGALVGGRYTIEQELGGGGMAVVYRARHVGLEHEVALKVVLPEVRRLPGVAERFVREARAATRLKSDHVARVFDVGTLDDGAPYFVMELLDGQDLASHVAEHGPVPPRRAVAWVLQACEALAEVHGLGIVHRDLKPANLFLTRGADGEAHVKLIDFGISRIDAPHDDVSLTQPAAVMGSPRYMAPEQMENAITADPRADIWGLGVVLHELLTGAPPYDGPSFVDIYAAILRARPAPPSAERPEVPRGLDDVVLRCLEPAPDARFRDVAELARALAPFGPPGSGELADAVARTLGEARARRGGTEPARRFGEAAPRLRPTARATVAAPAPRRGQKARVSGLLLFAVALVTLGVRAWTTGPRQGAPRGAEGPPENAPPSSRVEAAATPKARPASAPREVVAPATAARPPVETPATGPTRPPQRRAAAPAATTSREPETAAAPAPPATSEPARVDAPTMPDAPAADASSPTTTTPEDPSALFEDRQ